MEEADDYSQDYEEQENESPTFPIAKSKSQ